MVPTKDMQTTLPLPIESCRIDIKDAQWAENKDGSKISYQISGLGSHHRGLLGSQKFNFLQNLPKKVIPKFGQNIFAKIVILS